MQTNGKADYDAVHEFQDGLKAVPLSAYGKPYTPPKIKVDAKLDMSAPPDQVDNMDAATFFAKFAELLKTQPPHANDYPILDQMKRIGIEPGRSFSLASEPKAIQDALNVAPAEALPTIKAAWTRAGIAVNGWRTNFTAIGTYGTDYLHRAGARLWRPGRERPAGRRLSDRLRRRRGPAIRQRQALCPPLRQGSATARAGLLVADHV